MLAAKQRAQHEIQYRGQEHERKRAQTRPRVSLRERISAFACLALCVGTVWYIADQGAKIDQMNYNIDKMQSKLQMMRAENQALANQVDQLMRPSRILDIALNKLHMKYADPVQIPDTTK
jgi:cell division protein FtsL